MRSGAPRVERVGERRVEPLGGDGDLVAGEPERRVAQQRAGHEPGLGQHLEPVADPEHEPAVAGERGHRAHDRAEPGDDAGAHVVAVGEPARQDDGGGAVQRRLLVPQGDRLGAGQREGVERVAVAVAAREDTTTPIRTPIVSPPPCRPPGTSVAARPTTDDAAPERLERVRLDERVRQQLRRETLDDRTGGRLVGGLDRQLGAPTDAHVVDALDPEMAEAALDGPAGRIEDARLGRHVDRVAVARHGAITSSRR